MKDPKAEVLRYLENDRSLMGGRNLYNKLPNKNRAIQNNFARFTDTPANVARLHYELARAVGLTERSLKIALQKPVRKAKDVKEIDVIPEPVVLTALDKLLSFDPENPDYHESVALAKELEIKLPGRKKEQVYAALSEARQKEITAQVNELPVELKASIKMRDQFPFLRDSDCPDALKILVADMITSYENFKKNQPKLHEVLDAAEEKALADVVVKDYIENKQAWDELEHYRANGEVLGKHPLFERLSAKEEITGLSTPDLTKKISNLKINIGKNEKKGNSELVDRDKELLTHAEAELGKR